MILAGRASGAARANTHAGTLMAHIHFFSVLTGDGDEIAEIAADLTDAGHTVTEVSFEYGSRYKEVHDGRVFRPSVRAISLHPERVREMTTWECEQVDRCDMVIFLFRSGSLRPDGLMLLGYALGRGRTACVLCDRDFFRRDEIDAMLVAAGQPASIFYDPDRIRDFAGTA